MFMNVPNFTSVGLTLLVLILTIHSSLAAAGAGANVASSANPRPWKAGVARVVITPQELMWMAGYGARDKPAEGKLQDLCAKALALESPTGERLVLVTTDLVGLPARLTEPVAGSLRDKHGLTRAQIMFTSSHTHSGPLLADDLIVSNVHKLVTTVRDAAETPPAGYQLVWSDEFDGTALDMSKWSYRGLGQRREAVNVTDAASVGGGYLTIATYTAGGKHYTGMLGTEGKFERRFGYWQARIRFEDTPGMWSAFWIQTPTFGRPPNDPAGAGMEIDVIEHRVSDKSGKDISGEAHHALHVGGGKSQTQVTEDLKLGSGFHTYGVQWTETQYRFFVDGTLTWTTTPVSKRPEYIILSSEVQDKNWAGTIPAGGYGPLESSKTKMIVDYVRFYEPGPGLQPK